MQIGIVGAGVVGSATGYGFEKHGNKVNYFDTSKDVQKKLYNNKRRISISLFDLIENSEIIMICVPTPNNNGIQDLNIIKKVMYSIGVCLNDLRDYKVITVRSTVLPGTTKDILLPILCDSSKLNPGKDFGVCVNPEFLRENSSFDDFLNPSRIVIGAYDKKSGAYLNNIYKNFNTKEIINTGLEEAEFIKYASNVFLSTKISYFNELYLLMDKLNLNSNIINHAVSLDPRIGEYGVIGGRPYGGICLPKDTIAFYNYFKDKDIYPFIIEANIKINEMMKKAE